MSPWLGCALNATEVYGSRRKLNLTYPQVDENTFLIRTLRFIRKRDKCAHQTRRGKAVSSHFGTRSGALRRGVDPLE
jgi:hypothetical protein